MKWIKFGWGKDCSYDSSKNPMFCVDLSGIITPNKSLLEVSSRCIKTISEEYPGPYYLFASGGVDSQSMIWCWMNSGIPFTVISFRYIHDNIIYNNHDLEQLEQFSTKYNIPVTYKNFDPIEFVETELVSYATRYQCTSPQICTHMKMSEEIKDGTIIFSGNFSAHSYYTYTIFGIKRYVDITKRSIIPFFFLHDAELAGVINKVNSQTTLDLTSHDLYTRKIACLQRADIPVIPQVQKYTGFEQIKEYYDKQQDRVSIRDRLKFANKPSKRVFDVLFRYKLTDIIKYIDEILYIW
jgi:hypothetical protein